jgi:hypothetical protein
MDFIKGKETLVIIAVLIGGILLAFVGGLIGSTVLGWILFIAGLLLTAANFYFFFSNYRDIYETKRQWAYVGLGVLGLLVIVALVAMLVSSGKAGTSPLPVATVAPAVQATEAPTETVASTAAPSSTAAAPTVASTASGVKPVFVCLNEKAPYGLNIRVEPIIDAAYGGIIEWGACFTVDGKAAGYPGWYHVTAGQEGSTEGLSIGVDESKYLLWVNGEYLESFGVNLESLPEIEVPTK